MNKPSFRSRMTALGSSLGILALASGLPVTAQEAVQAQPTPGFQREAPEGAPNVVIVLLDDVGFGAASTFGGAAATPTMDRLAREGLSYNRFHTTAICSPTRASLLTGRNPHATGVGAVLNSADARPGYAGFHTKDTATIAEVLRQSGYSTAAFGKWHQTPDWELSQAGPFDRWPTGEGFEKFYGFHGGEDDQFTPTLVEGTTPLVRSFPDDYHLTEDLVDKSIGWIENQQALAPEKPFFLYLATGAIHAPIQVPQSYIDRYRGKFDQGWDRLREETFARQKKLGVIPAGTRLTPRPAELPAWDSLSPDEKRFAARQMEAYAAFLAHTDDQIGRLVDALEASGEFDNTLFFYVVGDNGASAEGGLGGSLDYLGQLQGLPEPFAGKIAGIERIGGRDAHAHVNSAWAWATNAPFQWTKTIASHLGGTRNPLIVTWPERIASGGGIRSQFGHVNDIVPTILEAAGITFPESVNGIAQKPIDGTSLVYTFSDAKAPERHSTQYFEVFGHRAIYHEGWMVSAFHGRLPWTSGLGDPARSFEDDRWELYDLRSDFSQAIDLAAKHPDRLADLKARFMTEAARNQVLPLRGQQFPSGLPDPMAGVVSRTYRQGMIGIPEKSIPHTLNRSWSVTAEIEAQASGGVIATVGGKPAGWSLYLDAERRPVFAYRLFELPGAMLAGAPLGPGTHTVRVDFDYDGPGYAKGGGLTLSVDGEPVARGTLTATPPALYTIYETFDVGVDTGSAAGAYPEGAAAGYPFPEGGIRSVTIEVR